MAKLLKLRRGTTSQHSSFTGAEGEVTVDTDKETLVVHDGSTAGGHPVAAQDMANVPAGTILGTQLENSGVTAGQYGSSSAIPIVTVDAQGLVTAASTTSIDSTRIDNGTSNVRVNNNGNIVTTRSGTDRFTVTNSGVAVVGNLTTTDNITVTSAAPKIFLVDSDTNDDFSINGDGGTFRIKSETDGANRFVVNSDGHVDIPGNLDVGAGVDVTGAITGTSTAAITGAVTCGGLISNSNVTIENDSPSLTLNDSNSENDFRITNSNGTFILHDNDAGATRMSCTSAGQFTFATNVDFSSGIDVAGNITTTSGSLTVDGIGSVEDAFKITDSAGTQYLLMGNQDSAGTNCPRIFKVGNAQLEIGTGDSWSDNTGGTFTNHFTVAKNGQITSVGNHDFSAGIDVTGDITVSGTVDGRDIASLGNKIDGIENGATADQTASEILTLIKTVDGAGSGLDADTLDGITAGNFLRSDQADTASGDITFSGGSGAATIGGGSDITFTNGDWTGNHCKIQQHNSTLYIVGSSTGIIFREGGNDRCKVDGSGNFIPGANNTYNLGSSSARWSNIYTNDLHLSNKGSSNEVDGSWGDWTIQEGESDLFLKNNRSGKKYKFNLMEVS